MTLSFRMNRAASRWWHGREMCARLLSNARNFNHVTALSVTDKAFKHIDLCEHISIFSVIYIIYVPVPSFASPGAPPPWYGVTMEGRAHPLCSDGNRLHRLAPGSKPELDRT